jgi:hypothetical protein
MQDPQFCPFCGTENIKRCIEQVPFLWNGEQARVIRYECERAHIFFIDCETGHAASAS